MIGEVLTPAAGVGVACIPVPIPAQAADMVAKLLTPMLLLDPCPGPLPSTAAGC
jgi:hypothetical protein